MPLAPGTRLGPSEVVAPLGAGGMGEVYRARDARLGRDVAIKALPEDLARDQERLARFRREAQLLAALNHPGIGAIHGLEEVEAQPFLVLELVEGETLAERLARGPVPVEEALALGRQMAEAIEDAHRRGIVHRDLKPANVKLTPDGRLKILDFGLAKACAADGDAAGVDLSRSPTLTAQGTEAGVLLGTAAYMAPEQARGKPADRQADIWAFGVVLYEMLAGRRLFEGETVSELLASILKTEPDWGALPDDTPPRIRELLRRCLTREPRQRLHDMGDARLEIEAALEGRRDDSPVPVGPRSAWRSKLLVGTLGLAAVGILTWAIRGNGPRVPSLPPQPMARFDIALPTEAPARLEYFPGRCLALSAEGRLLVYTTSDERAISRLCLRRLDETTSRVLPETDGAHNPFFSPDGRFVAFFTNDGDLKKVRLDGGRPLTVARGFSYGLLAMGSWSDDGQIVFDTMKSGLRVVSVDGGTVRELTRPTSEWHQDPQVLPGSDVVLYLVRTTSELRLESISLDGARRKTVVTDASHARYLDSGHLLFMRNGSLMLAPFDKDAVAITGPAVSVPLDVTVDHLNTDAPLPQLVVSRGGTLVYIPSARTTGRGTRLVWVDRHGASTEAATLPFAVPHFALSPDGGRLLVTGRDEGVASIGIYDFTRRTLTPLVDQPVDYPTGPAWSPDGRRVLFARWSTEESELFEQAIDAGVPATPILKMPGIWMSPKSFSPDGRFLAFDIFREQSGQDIWVMDREKLGSPEAAQPFAATANAELTPAFSPDGSFLAYESDESGRGEVYIRRFPGGGEKTRVSSEGGSAPQWSADGREIFFQSSDDTKMMAVAVQTRPSLHLGPPRLLFEGSYLASIDAGLSHAVSPDGQRFLMVPDPQYPLRSSRLVAVINWFEEIERLSSPHAR